MFKMKEKTIQTLIRLSPTRLHQQSQMSTAACHLKRHDTVNLRQEFMPDQTNVNQMYFLSSKGQAFRP